MAGTEELIFRTSVDTGKSVKDVDKLHDSIEDVNDEIDNMGDKSRESLDSLNEKVASGNMTMREAKKAVKEYMDIALQAGRESPIGQEAIQAAGELQDKIGDLRTEMQNAGTDGSNLKAALQFGGAVAAGFGAVKGAMGLLGIENENVAKTMMKLQQITMVLNGIEQIRLALEKESLLVTKGKVIWTKLAAAAQYVYTIAVGTTTGAMKALRVAMLAIPIIAIIAAIVALIAILVEFFSTEEKAAAMNDEMNASFERQNKALEANARAYKRHSDNKRALMEADNATAEQLFEFDKQRLLDEENQRKQSLALLEQNIADKKTAMIQAAREGNEELTKTIEEEIHAQQDKYSQLRELDGQYLVDKTLLEKKYAADKAKAEEDAQKEQQKKNEEWARKAKEQREKQAQEELEAKRKLEDLLVLNIEDANARKIAQLQLAQQREMEETIKKYGAQSEIVKQLEIKQANDLQALKDEIAKDAAEDQAALDKKAADDKAAQAEAERKSAKAQLEGELIQARDDFEAMQALKLEMAQLEMEQALAQTNLTEGEIFKIKQEYQQKVDEINQETANKELERQKNLQEATKNVLQMGLDAGQNLADAFFDYKIQKAKDGSAEELRLEKRKFEVNKKLQIAQAIMQGTQAVLAAYSSGAAIPIIGPVAGPAFAAAAGVVSALNIAKIASTQFEGGQTGTTTPSTTAPSVNVTQPNDERTTTSTQRNSNTNSSPGPQKVVLVDSELKAAINDNAQVSVVSSIG